MITCWSLPGHPKTNFIVCLTTWSTSCTDAQIQTSVNLQYDHGDLMLWKMLILHVAWSNKIIVQIIFIKGIYCWALIDTLDQPFTHNSCAHCDKIWPLIHFWYHHLWPKLASSILNFSRRKNCFQWYPDQSDWLNGAWDMHKMLWNLSSNLLLLQVTTPW